MGSFEKCMAVTEKQEGGWSDHAADPGGKTNRGITQATLSEYLGRPATVNEVRGLSKNTAREIYRKVYWDRICGDSLPDGIDLCVFDFGVNSGPSRSVKSLQTALGVKADGWVGEKTLAALAKVSHAQLVTTLCDRRFAFLKGLRTFPVFGKGWTSRVKTVRAAAMARVGGWSLPPVLGIAVPTAKAVPEPVVEKTVSTEQKVGIGAGALGLISTFTAFWRDNSDLLSDPKFLAVGGVLLAVIVFLLFRKPKLIEQLS